MAYIKRNLIDGETLIDKSLLDHMQNGIYDAHLATRISLKVIVTSHDMDTIIGNATDEDIGSFYLYLGETTPSYKKGSVYRIGEV